MQEADRRAVAETGLGESALMERAGQAVVDAMAARVRDLDTRRVTVLCGRGNNGGDGFVIARVLASRGASAVNVYLLARAADVTGAAKTALDGYRAARGSIVEVPDEAGWAAHRGAALAADFVVDAIVGTGLATPIVGLAAAVVADVNRSQARVVSVDVPSGLLADRADVTPPAIRAWMTVTFAAPKIPLVCMPAADWAGALVVADIGIPASIIDAVDGPTIRLIGPGDFKAQARPRHRDANKGSNGHVLVVAGSRGKTGAAALAAMAALRSGAGLVTAAVPASCLPIVASYAPELMTLPLDETADGTVAERALDDVLAFEASVIAVGPGLGRAASTTEFVRRLVAESRRPIVLDADGLNAFAGESNRLSGSAVPVVVTPHPGEMARLTGRPIPEIQRDRLDAAARLARDSHVHVVLKGAATVVAEPGGNLYLNPTGNPGMATGGMGDVLTGVIAACIAQTGDATISACLGVFLHGLAGDLAAAEMGDRGLLASDVIDRLPNAWQSIAASHGDRG